MPLVVTVFEGESLIMRSPSGEYIGRMKVGKVSGDRVRLATDLPRDVKILRGKLDREQYGDAPDWGKT